MTDNKIRVSMNVEPHLRCILMQNTIVVCQKKVKKILII